MSTIINLLLGLGIFLYGMHRLERALEALGSARVKKVLGKSTQSSLTSVFSGTIITAILQSSSMVSLIVLAFASAGIIPLFNAVGVILGANLGTTFTGWIVATLGFKMKLEAFALPIFGLSALVYVFSNEGSRRQNIAGSIMGLGLLLFGLVQMKDSVADLPDLLGNEFLSGLGSFSFLLVGLALTAVIQSSSAMTLIALTALNAGVIDMTGAAALIVGADIGTTSTTALGSIRGPAIAKQLALSHLIYNLFVDIFAFFVLIPILPWALAFIGVNDPLYGLVLFHSTFNLVGLFVFVPFLKPYSQWLSRFFVSPQKPKTEFLHKTPPVIFEAAEVALKNELELLVLMVMAINLRNLKLEPEHLEIDAQLRTRLQNVFDASDSFDERYQLCKELEGLMHGYANKVQSQALKPDDVETLKTILDSARMAVYSAKTLKDVREDLVRFRHEETPVSLKEIVPALLSIYQGLVQLLEKGHTEHFVDSTLKKLRNHNREMHDALHQSILAQYKTLDSSNGDLATALNLNRELWHAHVNLIRALELGFKSKHPKT